MADIVDTKRHVVIGGWVVLGTVLTLFAAVVVVGLVRGDTIEIDVSQGGGTARISGATGALGEAATRQEVVVAQSDLVTAVDDAEDLIESSALANVIPAVDFTGEYTNGFGLFYSFSQFGSAVTFSERDAAGFITAVASGVVEEETVVFAYETALGTLGDGELTWALDGTLSGYFVDGFGQRPVAMFPAG